MIESSSAGGAGYHNPAAIGRQTQTASHGRSRAGLDTENWFARGMMRLMFGLVGSVPALKRRMFRDMGDDD